MRITSFITKRRALAALAVSLLLTAAGMAVEEWKIFAPGDVIRASEINSNFDYLKTKLSNPQIGPGASTANSQTMGTLRFNQVSQSLEVANSAEGWVPLQQSLHYGSFVGGAIYTTGSGQVTSLTAGTVRGGLSIASGTITISEPGTYKLSYSSTLQHFTGTPGGYVSMFLEVNGASLSQTRRNQTLTSSAYGSVAADTIVALTGPTSTLKLKVDNSSSMGFYIFNPSVTIERI